MTSYLFLTGFLIIIFSSSLSATKINDSIPDNYIVIQDTATKITYTKVMTKSPFGAIWRTLVLPGWGQLYVENYWKAPVFFLGAGACAYLIIWNNTKFQRYQSDYNSLKSTSPSDKMGLDLLNRQKEFYRDNRDKSYFFLGVTYLLAAVDAYVGAYLFDFEVNDNVSFRISPYFNQTANQYAGLTFSLKLK